MELALIWFACIFAAAVIGGRKGIGVVGFLLGLLLGPLGVLIVLVMSGDRVSCRYCKEMIRGGAIKCPHCQSDLIARVEDDLKINAEQPFTNAYGNKVSPDSFKAGSTRRAPDQPIQ